MTQPPLSFFRENISTNIIYDFLPVFITNKLLLIFKLCTNFRKNFRNCANKNIILNSVLKRAHQRIRWCGSISFFFIVSPLKTLWEKRQNKESHRAHTYQHCPRCSSTKQSPTAQEGNWTNQHQDSMTALGIWPATQPHSELNKAKNPASIIFIFDSRKFQKDETSNWSDSHTLFAFNPYG